ncbi:MAG TPA: tetratricopeptide repeat protein [Planctomycetota bacterium]|nr:tetratricopeptide repeat protein [Planctomycetota bacterium]
MTETQLSTGLTLIEAIDTVLYQWERKPDDGSADRLTKNAEALIHWTNVALEEVEGDHGAKSPPYGIGLVTLGHIYKHTGDLRAALDTYQRGYEILKEHPSQNHQGERTCNEDGASAAMNALVCALQIADSTAEQNRFFKICGDLFSKRIDHWKADEFLDWLPEFLRRRGQDHAADELQEQNGHDYDAWRDWLTSTWSTKHWQKFVALVTR